MNISVTDNRGLKWLYGSVSVFAIISCIALITESFWLLLLPMVLLVVITGLYRLDWLMFFAVAITPLSINLTKTDFGIGVSLPSEPIIFGIMLLFLLKIIYDGGMDKKIAWHPVSLAIYFHLGWMLITTFTSSMPLVSFKATLARFCFILVFYFLGSQVFRNIKNIRLFTWLYLIPLIVVIIYAIYNQALAGFTEKSAHTSMVPFYNDHTAYAAAIAMFIPLAFGYMSVSTSNRRQVIIAAGMLIMLITAVVLSYTRASWISLVAALMCYLVFAFRVKTSIVIGSMATVILLYFSFQTKITMVLEKNEEQSSTDYVSHVESVSNISSDASNVERINRWHSAFNMFALRPFFGWGPGTYMFQYAPFQKWSERTIISKNFGEGGNAHSEYIGPLAEEGFIGPLTFILIGIIVIFRSSRLLKESKNPEVRMLIKGLILGLITYWVHGMVNNFLDTEKASVPFWAFIGALVALDCYHSKEKLDLKKSPEY